MGKQSKTIRNKRKIKVEKYENGYIDTSAVEKRVSKAFTREAQFTIVSIFFVTIVMISSAYAIFSSVQKQETYNTLTVGTLKIDFDQSSTDMGNIINLNGAYPTSDTDGQKTSPYSFKITNSGTLDAYYKVKIIDDTDIITEDGCSNNLLSKDKIKVSINGGTPFLLNSKEANSYIVNDGTLAASESRTFEIRIWIDETAGNEVLGKHYHGKIVVEGENTTSTNNDEENATYTNKNIVAAYTYSQVSTATNYCITGDEDTCNKISITTNDTNIPAGTIIQYKVNDTETVRFHVIEDMGTKLKLQSQKNTVNNVAWYAEENTNDDGTTTTIANNTKGPLTILPKLEETTSTWSNVNDQTYIMGTTVFKDNEFTGCDTTIACIKNTYVLEEKTNKSRMITLQEAISLGCTQENKTCPIWMSNYLNNSTGYEGTEDDSEGGNAYWTLSTGAYSSENAWYVGFSRRVGYNTTNFANYGARAVVEINK